MKNTNRLINVLIILSLVAFGALFYLKRTLPPPEVLLPEIKYAPIQIPTNEPEFEFDFNSTTYRVIPRADYDLWGLVVTHNNINNFDDIYHDETSVDLKDICVVWGKNATSGLYEKGKYKSGPFTCYWKFKDDTAWQEFNAHEIANNHLIASNPTLQEKIRNLKIGDQVHLKGMLVNYENTEVDWQRDTSMTRDDTGNHSCEVIFVESMQILHSSNAKWYELMQRIKWALLALIGLKIFLFGWELLKD